MHEPMNIQVLGIGCSKCQVTVSLIERIAREKGKDVRIEKIEQRERFAPLGVTATPGVIIDGKVVHAGGVPRREAVEQWLEGPRN